MAIDYSRSELPKGRTRKQLKARRDRDEAKVKRAVRAACLERDGYCRVWPSRVHIDLELAGPSEWAHMHVARRSKTRGQDATERHATATSLMLCRAHHTAYDGKTLVIEALTDKGADGPLKFTYGGRSYSE